MSKKNSDKRKNIRKKANKHNNKQKQIKTEEKKVSKKQEEINQQLKNVSDEELENNEKESKKKMIIQYMIPLILLIIVAVIYIPTQKNVLLIPFAILTMVTLFGWDASTRTCPKCKKWNSVSWLKTENIKRKTTKSKKNFIGKEKEIKKISHIRKIYKKCRNCGHEFETEQNKLF